MGIHFSFEIWINYACHNTFVLAPLQLVSAQDTRVCPYSKLCLKNISKALDKSDSTRSNQNQS